MTHFAVPTVNLLIVNNQKILLSRRANTGWMDGHLVIPGGHVEENETPIQAAVREANEELGVEINPKDLDFLCIAVRNKKPEEHIGFEFVLTNTDYPFTNTEPNKCSELCWVSLEDLPDDIVPDFKQIIQKGLVANQRYIEVGY